MTVSDMPLVDATAAAGSERARVLTRARARLAVTFGDVKILHVAGRVWSVAVSDARRWWLVAARPPSLRAWLRAHRLAERRVPADNWLLRGLWIGHNWTFGLVTVALSVVLLLVGGGLRWLAGHPLRFWMACAMASAIATWVALT